MKLSVLFPVSNRPIIQDCWPIRLSEGIFIFEKSDGRLEKVGIQFNDLAIDEAPTIAPPKDRVGHTEIKFNNSGKIAEAQEIILSWQAIITPLFHVDVAYDRFLLDFTADNEHEKDKLQILSLSSDATPITTEIYEFGIIGRAALAEHAGSGLIEIMGFYRHGQEALRAGRFVDAYNNFFLFLESKFGGGKFKNDDIREMFLKHKEITSATIKSARDHINYRGNLPASFEKCKPIDAASLIHEIILLRGRLRHHSQKNKGRWNPNRQKNFIEEAIFIHAICLEIATALAKEIIWDKDRADIFLKQAKDVGMAEKAFLTITLKLDQQFSDVRIEMSTPRGVALPKLASIFLHEALRHVNAKYPDALILGIRGYREKDNRELFRYDLGPGIER